jgi:hypothetical protein
MKKSKKIAIFGSIFLIFLILFYFLIYRPVNEIYAQVNSLLPKAKELKVAFSKNDIDLLEKKLNDFDKDYLLFKTSAKKIYWLSFVPYVSDFKNAVEVGD